MNNDEKFWIGIGDIHEDLALLRMIPDLELADGIIISGDITNRGNKVRAEKIFNGISKINSKIYAQIGNMDLPEITVYLEEKNWNIHAKGKEIAEDIGIMGIGYSSPTPFNTPSEASTETMAQWLEDAYDQVKHLPKLILVAHDPPYGTITDKIAYGESVGNMAVRNFIERVQPDVCLTGHIHEARDVDFLGKTKIINTGMLNTGGYGLIRLKEGKLTAELKQV